MTMHERERRFHPRSPQEPAKQLLSPEPMLINTVLERERRSQDRAVRRRVPSEGSDANALTQSAPRDVPNLYAEPTTTPSVGPPTLA